MSVVRYESVYSQKFYHKGRMQFKATLSLLRHIELTNLPLGLIGVDLGPEEHSQGALARFRRSTVEFARLDPSVGAIQYFDVVGNGVGNQWSVVFSEVDFNMVLDFDRREKKWNGVRTRKIQYTLSFKLVQECRPMLSDPTMTPRQIGTTLA